MRRNLIWIEDESIQGWGCSDCAWVFNPVGLPTGKSLEEMMRKYEEERDKHFAAHVCAEHPRGKKI
jgi:hypothetical protein